MIKGIQFLFLWSSVYVGNALKTTFGDLKLAKVRDINMDFYFIFLLFFLIWIFKGKTEVKCSGVQGS